MIGTTLSHYRVTAKLGAGVQGIVYRARDTRLGRDVAIKVLPPEVVDDPGRLARFRREAHVLASLNHPHIAAIYGFEEAEGRPFLVMELVEGKDLAAALGVPLPGLRVESPPPGGALAILDAHVLTLEPEKPEAEAVLVNDGRLALVGTSDEVRAETAGARVFDARGRAVVPGFIDSHVHLELACVSSKRTTKARSPRANWGFWRCFRSILERARPRSSSMWRSTPPSSAVTWFSKGTGRTT